MPFAYVQVNGLLLLVFDTLAPIAIACFTSPDEITLDIAASESDVSNFRYNRSVHVFVSLLLTIVVVAGFTAMYVSRPPDASPYAYPTPPLL